MHVYKRSHCISKRNSFGFPIGSAFKLSVNERDSLDVAVPNLSNNT